MGKDKIAKTPMQMAVAKMADAALRAQKMFPVDQPPGNDPPGKDAATDLSHLDPSAPVWRRPKFGIAMSGGGSRGDFEVGAVRYLYDHALGGFGRMGRPAVVTGTSAGTVNAASLAQGSFAATGRDSLAALEHVWLREMRQSSDFYVQHLKPALVGAAANAGLAAAAGFSIAGWVGAIVGPASGPASTLYQTVLETRSVFRSTPLRDRIEAQRSFSSAVGLGLRGRGLDVGRDADGRRFVVVRGYDDVLAIATQVDTGSLGPATRWSPWHRLGGISSDPIAVADAGAHGVVGRLTGEEGYGSSWLPASARPAELGLWRNDVVAYPAGTFLPQQRFITHPTVIHCPGDNTLRLLACNADGVIATSVRRLGRWEPWTSGPVLKRQVAGTVTGTCRATEASMIVFARSSRDEILFHEGVLGTDAPWQVLGGSTTSDIAVHQDPIDGRIDIFWRGPDGQAYRAERAAAAGSPWSAPSPLGGLLSSNVTVAATGGGDSVLELFVRGMDGALYVNRQAADGTWTDGWQSLGAPPGHTFLSDATVKIFGDGLEIYAVATDDAVWFTRQLDPTTFAPWTRLGGSVWTGIKLRMAMVALETGELRYVDEAGRFTHVDPDDRYPWSGAQPVSLTDAIQASCAAPAVFEAVSIDGLTWVDGGLRRVIPVAAAFDAGADFVYAIASAPVVPAPMPRTLPAELGLPTSPLDPTYRPSPEITSYGDAGFIDVALRALTTLFPSGIAVTDLTPEVPWRQPVMVIQPTLEVHSPLDIDPGAIRLSYDYGWMRAADVHELDPARAMDTSDAIMQARIAAWRAETAFRIAYLVATNGVVAAAGVSSPALFGQVADLTHRSISAAIAHLELVRAAKDRVASAIIARRDAGLRLPFDPSWDLLGWAQDWEEHGTIDDDPDHTSWNTMPWRVNLWAAVEIQAWNLPSDVQRVTARPPPSL